MSQQPVDLTTSQPPVSVGPPAPQPPEPGPVGIRDLLERLAALATERAAATEDAEERAKLERVAQLARDLSTALSEVEVRRGPA